MEIFPKLNESTMYSPAETLTEFANKYETDKGDADKNTLSWGPSHPTHDSWSYTKTYEKYFNSFRNSKISMLEIGICDGRFPYASPKMWLNFFENIDLYCVDNFWSDVPWGSTLAAKLPEIEQLNKLGVTFIYADQGNYKDWQEIKSLYPNKFDFIVEDGSHYYEHMAISLAESIDIVKPGGYYFMEDIQNPAKSRGMWGYDNTQIYKELKNALETNILNFVYLKPDLNKKLQDSYKLVELTTDEKEMNYLAVFKRL